MTLTRSDIVLKLSNDIFREAKEVGADAIAVCCPLCQANLDTRQIQIEDRYRVRYGIPVLYFTQLMGLFQGVGPGEAHHQPSRCPGDMRVDVRGDEPLASRA
jgi:heterodisulfide reductase subunit B